MKKTKKILLILLTFLIFTFIFNIVTNVYAAPTFSVESLTGTPPSDTSLKNVGNGIVTILTTIGIVLSVIVLVILGIIVLVILGIKYMMGSVEERADYKKTMMPYVIGATLVFAASIIANIIYNIANNIGA